MIFVTVGDKLPFERLIKAVDLWAGDTGCKEVFAQIGEASYLPQNITFCKFCSLNEYYKRVAAADLIVGHVGIGTILTAMEHNKPILVMPRLVKLGEVTNEHQIATAKRFLQLQFVEVAFSEAELIKKLQHDHTIHTGKRRLSPTIASSDLLQTLRDFVSK